MDGSREPSVSLPDAGDTGDGDAHAHPRFLPAGAGDDAYRRHAGTLKRVLAATVVWTALGAGVAAGEWRDWCRDPGSGASLGWHFYCDRQEEAREAATGGARATDAALCRPI